MKHALALLFLCICVMTLLGGCRSGSLSPAPGSTAQPPLIPHEVDAAAGYAVCQDCHRSGEGGAPQYPAWHATLVDCGQCHVPQDAAVTPFAPHY